MQLTRITDPNSDAFNRLMDLYEQSFPPAERRERQSLASLLSKEARMHFCSIIDDDGTMAGLFIYWDLHTFIYMEHFAVFPDMRNRGIGRRMLQHLFTLADKPLVLEAEPADDEMAKRRIDFYRRNGCTPVYPTFACGNRCQAFVLGPVPEDRAALKAAHRAIYGSGRPDVVIDPPPGAEPQPPFWMAEGRHG